MTRVQYHPALAFLAAISLFFPQQELKCRFAHILLHGLRKGKKKKVRGKKGEKKKNQALKWMKKSAL